MRNWTTSESRLVVAWAKEPEDVRRPIEALADALERTPEAIKEFLGVDFRVTSGPGKGSHDGTGTSTMRLIAGRTPMAYMQRSENTSSVSKSA